MNHLILKSLKVNAEAADMIAALRDQGLTQDEIGVEIGVSQNRVSAVLRQLAEDPEFFRRRDAELADMFGAAVVSGVDGPDADEIHVERVHSVRPNGFPVAFIRRAKPLPMTGREFWRG